MKPFLHLLSAAVILSAPFATAQETAEPEATTTDLFRRALFAEEAELDLDVAEKGYTEVLERFAEQRTLAATACFRLAEVHRKRAAVDPEGDSESLAARHYERVVREFPDMTTLATLSRENLVAMGRTPPEPGAAMPDDEESRRIRELKEWAETSPDKLEEDPAPLATAAAANLLRVAKYLIGLGVDLDKGGPLSEAAANGHLDMVELLLAAGADPGKQEGEPPIHRALWQDRMEVVKTLIDADAHLGAVNSNGDTPLISLIYGAAPEESFAPSLGRDRKFEYIALLLENGANIDARNAKNGNTAVNLAAKSGEPKFVSFLIERGADVNVSDEVGQTPIFFATGGEELVELLIKSGADVNHQDKNGLAPLHYLMRKKPDLKIVEKLLAAGADSTLRISKAGWTPLHFWAASSQDKEIARALYRAGGNPIALATSSPPGVEIRNAPTNNTPLGILSSRTSEFDVIVRDFYEHGIQTLSPGRFADAIWFAMPMDADKYSFVPQVDMPTELIPNLFPVFTKGEAIPDPPGHAETIIEVFSGVRKDREQTQPTLEKIRILRKRADGEGGSPWQTLNIFYEALAAAAETDSEPILHWGDVILMDTERGSKNEWTDFSDEVRHFISLSARKTVEVEFGDISSIVNIRPKVERFAISVNGDYLLPYDKLIRKDGLGYSEYPPTEVRNLRQLVRYRDDLDLSAARVIRHSGETVTETPVDLESEVESPLFLLRDGDRVVIPKRAGFDVEVPRDRDTYIWLSRTDTHFLQPVIGKGSFAPRPVEGIALARIFAEHYSDVEDFLPHPDFSRIALRLPGENAASETVSLPEDADRVVPWGTIIELPIKSSSKSSTWTGLTEEEKEMLSELSKVTISLAPEEMAVRARV